MPSRSCLRITRQSKGRASLPASRGHAATRLKRSTVLYDPRQATRAIQFERLLPHAPSRLMEFISPGFCLMPSSARYTSNFCLPSSVTTRARPAGIRKYWRARLRGESGEAAAPHVRPGFPAEYRRRRGRRDRRATLPALPPPCGGRAHRGDRHFLRKRGLAQAARDATNPPVACPCAASHRAPRLRRFQTDDDFAAPRTVNSCVVRLRDKRFNFFFVPNGDAEPDRVLSLGRSGPISPQPTAKSSGTIPPPGPPQAAPRRKPVCERRCDVPDPAAGPAPAAVCAAAFPTAARRPVLRSVAELRAAARRRRHGIKVGLMVRQS